MSKLVEIEANISYYSLNSNYQDPMYQYMLKMLTEESKKVPRLRTNFTEVDNFIVDYSPILRYGSFECSVPGKEAYMDSFFSCFLFQLPFFLEKLQLGWIGFVFVLPIMLISIFGGIKESYRWFILYQAIWDAFICYDFICARPTLLGWFSSNYPKQTTCFYYITDGPNLISAFAEGFTDYLRNASFIPIFLLAFSRFFAMYFSRLYQNFTKSNYKILLFILVFNFVMILLVCSRRFYEVTALSSMIDAQAYCFNTYCPQNITKKICYQSYQEYFQCNNRAAMWSSAILSTTFTALPYTIPPLMFSLSILCVVFLFYKISSQLKFQLQTNRSSFIQTLKISTVVGFQCLIMTFIFMITSIQKFMQIKAAASDYSIYSALPPWLFLLQYSTTTTSLSIIRVFLDSIIVLSVLTGYSSCVVKSVKFAYLWLTNPQSSWKKIRAKFALTNNSVTVLSHLPNTKTQRKSRTVHS